MWVIESCYRPCRRVDSARPRHPLQRANATFCALTSGSAGPPVQSVGLHIFLVTAVTGCPQLADQLPKLIHALGSAGLLGEVRGRRGTLIKIRKIRPKLGRGKGIGRGISIRAFITLVGARRNKVRKRTQK